MSRLGIAVLAGMFALASAPAVEAATAKKSTSTAAKKRAAKKRAAAKKAKAKKLAAAKRAKKRKKAKRGSKSVAVASDARVKYGKSNMPPGFAWPPSAAMKRATSACEEALDTLGVAWERAEPEGKMVAPVLVPTMEIGGIKYTSAYRSGPHKLDCQLVHVLATIGPDLVALGLREVKFGSIYRNTPVRAHGVTKPILSRHALGLAMDIKAFIDAEGRIANVELDYLKGDPLLHGIEDAINRSNRFRIVLTPGNDPISHYDHFHIEASVDFTAFR